jgi:hypothetical protein
MIDLFDQEAREAALARGESGDIVSQQLREVGNLCALN